MELDNWFGRVRTEFGARVIRFWAYPRNTCGGRDWRGLDRVFRFDTAEPHYDRLTSVVLNGRPVFIDITDQVVLDPRAAVANSS